MDVLIVKMSSLGDVVHTFPAVTDAAERIRDVRFDWVVEEGFADVPALHPAVERVIPVSLRRWRKTPLGSLGDVRRFLGELRHRDYDLVLDAQGLIKSALVASAARGPTVGLDRTSAREGVAALFYHQALEVPRVQHAVERTRQLFARAFCYDPPQRVGRYGLGIDAEQRERGDARERAVLLLHGTTWGSKEWPLACWVELAQRIAADGLLPLVPWASDAERERATRIVEDGGGEVLARTSLAELLALMQSAAGAVSVDSGLGHLAAAADLPQVSVFGATNPALTGPYGRSQKVLVGDHLPCIPCLKRTCQYPIPGDSSKIHPPCFANASPQQVWQALKELMG